MDVVALSKQAWAAVAPYFCLPYLIAFMAIAYAFKQSVNAGLSYFVNRLTKGKVKCASMQYSVGLIGLLVAVLWKTMKWETDMMRLFVSYAVGTTMHDLVVFEFIQIIKRITGTVNGKQYGNDRHDTDTPAAGADEEKQ